MRICHVSFGVIARSDLDEWLHSISYHTKVLGALAERHAVESFHHATISRSLILNGVRYTFVKHDLTEKVLLSKMVTLVKSANPDVIILHGFHSSVKTFVFVSRFTTVPIYVQHHGEQIFRWPKARLQSYIDKYVGGYFFSSAQMGEEWVQAGRIADSKKIHEVLEATSSFEPIATRTGDTALTFLWVGRVDDNKDPLTLIDGFTAFLKDEPRAKLYVISKDNEQLERKLKPTVARFTDSIILVGSVNHEEMTHWFARVNFVISTSHYEGSGIAVLEAISAQCIPVLTDIPSFRTITGNGNVGILFTPRSAEALATALRQASKIDLNSERYRLKERFMHYLSATAIARQLEKIIEAPHQKEKASILL